MELNLNGLFSTYVKLNKSNRNEVYYNLFNNNLIVFKPWDKSCDTESICNSISIEAYRYLINILNTTKDLIVVWSQVEGTTSDYKIYYGLKPENFMLLAHKSILSQLRDYVDDSFNGFKYNIIKDRKVIRIERGEM